MSTIGQKIIARKLQDFAGARIAGQLVLSDPLINELLHLGLKEAISSPPTTAAVQETPPTASSDAPKLDLAFIVQQFNIEQLQYRSEASKTILDISAQLVDKSDHAAK